MKIVANKTILHNTITDCIFLAGKGDEECQLKFPSQQHIKYIGELSYPIDDIASILRELFLEIEHGDNKHREWLKDKIESFISRKCY